MHIGGDKKDVYHTWVHRQFDAWVTPVQWLADRVLEKTAVPKERLHIVPLGIEMARFIENQPDRRAARDRYGLPHDATIVGMVGRLDPKKCQDVVIRAISALRPESPDLHLLVIGEQSHGEGDEYVATVHRLVEELGLVDRVHFRPFEQQVEWAYAPMDVFVLASKSEAYGMVTIEAMASGTPVIGTNDGGTVSLIDHGHNGLLVTPKSVEELTAALKLLLTDRTYALQLALTARREAPARFSHSAQCDAWERLLDSL
jgi:glycosyltransferase involved in cell wall biosynthesis